MLREDRHAPDAQRPATAVVTGVVAALALVILALVIVAVVALLVGGGGSGRSEEQRRRSEEQRTWESVRWSNFQGILLPSSPAGPTVVDGGRASGFAHTRAGAVMAAIHIPFRADPRIGPAVYEPTIASQVVGADKEKFLAAVRTTYDAKRFMRYGTGSLHTEFGRPVAEYGRVWAFRVDAYDESAASIHVLTRTEWPGSTCCLTTPKYENSTYTVRWIDGDWRLDAPPNGMWHLPTTVRTVPNDYVVIGDPYFVINRP